MFFKEIVYANFKTQVQAAAYFETSIRNIRGWCLMESFPSLKEQERLHSRFGDMIDLHMWRRDFLKFKEAKRRGKS